jgi:hypothetical protein
MDREIEMHNEQHKVPVQRVRGYSSANPLLGSHVGTTDYLLVAPNEATSQEDVSRYQQNETFWADLLTDRISFGDEIVLEKFHVLDWFPRAPGLYHTKRARFSRELAFEFLHRGWESPIRDHANTNNEPGSSGYTKVFMPEGKLSMLQGGIGAIRLKPIKLPTEPHWLLTASSDGIPHTGVPLAVPLNVYRTIRNDVVKYGALRVDVHGVLEFVPDPFTRLFDRSVFMQKMLLRVTQFVAPHRTAVGLENSVAVSFVSDYKGRPDVYAIT